MVAADLPVVAVVTAVAAGEAVTDNFILHLKMKQSTAMKKYSSFVLWLPFILVACSAPKTYFTAAIRTQVESSHQPLEKVQFYADRDIV